MVKSLKAICGLAAVALFLSACGSGGSQPAGSTAASNASPTSVATSSGSGSSSNTGSASSTGSGSTTSSGSGSGSNSNPPPPTGSATLKWTAPTTNSNGSALTDLAGFHIHYGTNPSSLTSVITVPSASTASYVVSSLSAGTWYFAVSAYTNSGLEGPLSNVGSKTIT